LKCQTVYEERQATAYRMVQETVYEDRTFSFITKSPPAAVLIKRAAKIAKASGEPNKNKVAEVTRDQLEEIVKIKEKDLNAADMDAAVRMLMGTARSMGITVAR